MKKTITILSVFLSINNFGQIQKLSELTSNKFIDSGIVYDDNNEDVFGYFLLFQLDKVEKKVFEFEYFLLDKNLNKISSGRFLQPQISPLLSNLGLLKYRLTSVKKNNDMIYFSLFEEGGLNALEFYVDKNLSYRTLSLIDYKVSDLYLIQDFNLKKFPDRITDSEYQKVNYYQVTQNNGFLIDNLKTPDALYGNFNKYYKSVTELHFFDFDFNKKWTYYINQDKDSKSFYKYKYFKGYQNEMVFLRRLYENATKYSSTDFVFIDAENGKKKFEIKINDDKTVYEVNEILFDEDKFYIYAEVYDNYKEEDYYYDKKLGYVKIDFDRKTGKELSRNFFYWNQLEGKLEIDKFGEIKKYGFIHFLDYKITSDGKTIVIAEGYDPNNNFKIAGFGKGTKILDLFLFEFDPSMKIISFEKVSKVINSLDMVEYGLNLKKYHAFDFAYSQNLKDKDSYIFFYSDNEKTGINSKRNPNWVLGIIVYTDGKFIKEKMPLKTINGNIYPVKAKNGYIVLQEKIGEEYEIRLEKIQY